MKLSFVIKDMSIQATKAPMISKHKQTNEGEDSRYVFCAEKLIN